MKFYIYTAVVFVAMYFYVDDAYVWAHADLEWKYIIPHYAFAFAITFGAKWFLEYFRKPKDKKED